MDQLPLAAFSWPIQFCAFSTAATFVVSVITGNVSQVDRLWTFLPTIYTAYFALLPLWPTEQPFPLAPFVPKELHSAADGFSPRATLMLGLIVVWMFRLSYNTWRRGLFNLQDEDYRWAVLRANLPSWFFQVFNLTFIAGIQNVLLLCLGVPAYFAVQQSHGSLGTSDYALAAISIVILVTEFTSDNQQFAFQGFKSAYLGKSEQPYNAADHWPGARLAWTKEDAKRGFVTKGLWAYSRHPNFACEQSFWWIITLFPVIAKDPPSLPHYSLKDIDFSQLAAICTLDDNLRSCASFVGGILADLYPLLPAFLLSCLFIGSTIFTESITMKKYPAAYKAYKKRVAMFDPTQTLQKGFLLSSKQKAVIEAQVWGEKKKTQ